ncbi:MAG: FMN-binding protein [Kineosporiaceae bacterium]|nr:FMN-binding protein [Kineosporiaceae bacterium]MBK7623084.1 FMN-binding protein [Kineosporiaceae bacterium]MBK8074966.1 FMN-binding protein [Kineosporiaceae bacterium]
MRRIVIAVMSTISGLVLLFSYHTSRNETTTTALDPAAASALDGQEPDTEPTPTPTLEAPADTGPTPAPSMTSVTPSPAATSRKPTPATTTKAATTSSKSYLGDAVDTQFGPVQVKITVRATKIIKSVVTQVPMNNGHDERINNYAVPLLNAAAVKWQSAEIESVSGATVTSEAYKRSLQSAMDAAHL